MFQSRIYSFLLCGWLLAATVVHSAATRVRAHGDVDDEVKAEASFFLTAESQKSQIKHYGVKHNALPCPADVPIWARCDRSFPAIEAHPDCPPGYGYIPQWGFTHAHQHGSYADDDGYAYDDGSSYEQNTHNKGICLTCASGFWSHGGYHPCMPCGRGVEGGWTSVPGATHPHLCRCLPGYGGEFCTLCRPNFFSPGGIDPEDPHPPCKQCPTNSLGSPESGATSPFECGGCVPGFGGLECSSCPAGTFSTGVNNTACQSCGTHQTSPPGSPGIEYCDCEAGFGRLQNSTACTRCPIGTFYDPHYSHRHHGRLSIASNAPTTCLSCNDANPGGSFTTLAVGSTSQSDCVCLPGYGGELCEECPVGTWSPGGTTEPCCHCKNGFTTLNSTATGPDECVDPGCPPGTGFQTAFVEDDVRAGCVTCQSGTFSPGYGPGEDKVFCKLCPIGMSSAAGSVQEEECFCIVPGFGIMAENVNSSCQLCPVGTYSFQIRGRNECVRCPEGMTTLGPGSSSSTSCVCAVGYGWNGADGCAACEAPFYQGYLDGNKNPVTSATTERPYPHCVECPDFGLFGDDTATQIVGGTDKGCLDFGGKPGAYCTIKTVREGDYIVPTCY